MGYSMKKKSLFYGLRIEQMAAVMELAEKTGLKPYEVTGRLIDLALEQVHVVKRTVQDLTLEPPKED